MPLQLGTDAPDFALKDQNERVFHAAECKGKRVLLSFHPLAWTKVCADQMKSLEDNQDKFAELNTIAVGINVDSHFSKKAWADSLGITRTRLLADFWPHGGVASQYGLFIEKAGISNRANVIVDENGDVVFVRVYDIPQLPDISEILKFIENM
ncbi:MAG: redoxin domain-containing protein [Candidatus Coatesbacteria bacterium]|nr:redoxin domain-containing protein [Candidatus Coatesbacteria bacterium]